MLLSALVTGIIGFSFFSLLQLTRRTAPNHVLAISVAGNLFVAQVVQYVWGTEGISVPPIIRGSATLGSLTVPANDLIIPPLTAVAVLGLWYWLYRSRSGMALRAVADDQSAARLAGINADRTLTVAVGVAAFMAGLAGALTAPSQTLTAHMWIHPLLISFAVVVLGGRGSLVGAVVAAFVLGIAETLTGWFWSEAASQYTALLLIVLGLVVRPGGLAGLTRYETR